MKIVMPTSEAVNHTGVLDRLGFTRPITILGVVAQSYLLERRLFARLM